MSDTGQLASVRRILGASLVAFLVASAQTVAAVFGAAKIDWSAVAVLIWICFWGVAYWHGSDFDADWWIQAKKTDVKFYEIAFPALLVLAFVALPVLLLRGLEQGGPADITRVLRWALFLKACDLVARLGIWVSARPLPKGPERAYFSRPGHFGRVMVGLFIIFLMILAYGKVPDRWWGNVLFGPVLVLWQVGSEVWIWNYREATKAKLRPGTP